MHSSSLSHSHLGTLESQLSEYAEREESTMSISREAKEKVEQAMLERDQAVSREAQGRREIARLLESRRTQASEAMGHEEQAVSEMRTRMEEQLRARDDSISKLGVRVTEMQSKMERAVRDSRSSKNERESLMDDVIAERKRLRATIDDFATRTKESVERRDRAEGERNILFFFSNFFDFSINKNYILYHTDTQTLFLFSSQLILFFSSSPATTLTTTQDLAEKEQEMALIKAELNDKMNHLSDRLSDMTKQNSSKSSEVKRLENDLRNLKVLLSKERIDGSNTRSLLQEEASRVTETAAKQVADIQSRLDKSNRDHADGQASTASLLAAHERRSSNNVRELQENVDSLQRLIREKNEENSRLNSRAVQLEQQLTVAISGQQDLEQQMLSLSREMETLRDQRREATKKQRDASSRMSGLIQSEETRLRQLSEGRMENARLNREVQRLEATLGRKSGARSSSRSPTRA